MESKNYDASQISYEAIRSKLITMKELCSGYKKNVNISSLKKIQNNPKLKMPKGNLIDINTQDSNVQTSSIKKEDIDIPIECENESAFTMIVEDSETEKVLDNKPYDPLSLDEKLENVYFITANSISNKSCDPSKQSTILCDPLSLDGKVEDIIDRTEEETGNLISSRSTKSKQSFTFYNCEICNCLFIKKRELLEHTREKHPLVYNCKDCDYSSTNKENMKMHNKKHFFKKKFALQCWACAVLFETAKSFIAHLSNLCYPSAYYRCATCTYATVRRDYLRHHFRVIHSESCPKKRKPSKYLCEGNKISQKLQNLPAFIAGKEKASTGHEYFVIEVYPSIIPKFNCSNCRFRANSKNHIRLHILNEHSVDPSMIYCPNCSQIFQKKSCLFFKHIAICGLDIYKCKYCTTSWTNHREIKVRIKKHLESKHKKEIGVDDVNDVQLEILRQGQEIKDEKVKSYLEERAKGKIHVESDNFSQNNSSNTLSH